MQKHTFVSQSEVRTGTLKEWTYVQRIVAELVDFRDNVTISVSVRGPQPQSFEMTCCLDFCGGDGANVHM